MAKQIPAGRHCRDIVNLIDVTATIYDATGVSPSENSPNKNSPLSGRSLLNPLKSDRTGLIAGRTTTFSGRERHSSSRFNSLSYPQRCIRRNEMLLIHNMKPERWPAGTPQKFNDTKSKSVSKWRLGPMHGGYHDIDACPTLTYLIQHRDEQAMGRFLQLSVAKRPEFELYDVVKDPACLHNLAAQSKFATELAQLKFQLRNYLKKTGDPRVLGKGDIWETYPRYSRLRWFPTPQWAQRQPAKVPQQPWLEKRRPRGKDE